MCPTLEEGAMYNPYAKSETGAHDMSNVQVRLIASAIVLLAGAVLANTDNIDVNVSLAIILVSVAVFATEYVRSQKQ